ncbi:hypothetical protein [Caenimonas soli]|uniref:hypothetical protein n=1 Tax=Caenimonas soli TaxID=2735555 RepID=UPI001551C1E5|nr:hypothetical protein [Caenimonas soli]NPC58704.1 hypothetical protein [Caenimonas soli]
MANSSTRLTSAYVIPRIFLAMTIAALGACGGGSGGGASTSSSSSAATTEQALSQKPMKTAGLIAQDASVVNTTTAGDQKVRAVGALADGGYTVAWLSEDELYTQRYDAAGVKVGPQTLIPFSFEPSSLAIAVRSDGGIAVAYGSTRTPSPVEPWIVSSGIYARLFDAGGAPVGGETEVVAVVQNQIGARTLNYVADPAILSWDDGSFLVGWASISEDYTGKVPSFQTQRYDSQGQPAGGRLNVGSGDIGTSFELTPALGGGYLVSTFRRAAGELYVRYTQVDLGHTVALPYAENGLPAKSVLLPLKQGGYVLLSVAGSSAYSQMFDRNGSPMGKSTSLSSLPSSASALSDGGYVVFWGAAGAERLVAQRHDSAGAVMGEAFAIDTDGAMPEFASLQGAALALAWSAAGSAGDMDVVTQRFTPTP